MGSLVSDELVKRLVGGDTTASDRALLVSALYWLWEGADIRVSVGDPAAGPLFEVCDTIARFLDKPTLTADDGQALVGSLEAAFALCNVDSTTRRTAA